MSEIGIGSLVLFNDEVKTKDWFISHKFTDYSFGLVLRKAKDYDWLVEVYNCQSEYSCGFSDRLLFYADELIPTNLIS